MNKKSFLTIISLLMLISLFCGFKNKLRVKPQPIECTGNMSIKDNSEYFKDTTYKVNIDNLNIDKQVIYDDNSIKLDLLSITYDGNLNVYFNFVLQNNTDDNIKLHLLETEINNTPCLVYAQNNFDDPFDIYPFKANQSIQFSYKINNSELKKESISKIVSFNFTMSISHQNSNTSIKEKINIIVDPNDTGSSEIFPDDRTDIINQQYAYISLMSIERNILGIDFNFYCNANESKYSVFKFTEMSVNGRKINLENSKIPYSTKFKSSAYNILSISIESLKRIGIKDVSQIKEISFSIVLENDQSNDSRIQIDNVVINIIDNSLSNSLIDSNEEFPSSIEIVKRKNYDDFKFTNENNIAEQVLFDNQQMSIIAKALDYRHDDNLNLIISIENKSASELYFFSANISINNIVLYPNVKYTSYFDGAIQNELETSLKMFSDTIPVGHTREYILSFQNDHLAEYNILEINKMAMDIIMNTKVDNKTLHFAENLTIKVDSNLEFTQQYDKSGIVVIDTDKLFVSFRNISYFKELNKNNIKFLQLNFFMQNNTDNDFTTVIDKCYINGKEIKLTHSSQAFSMSVVYNTFYIYESDLLKTGIQNVEDIDNISIVFKAFPSSNSSEYDYFEPVEINAKIDK